MVSRTTAFSNDTEILAHTGACRLKAVIIDITDAGDAENYVQLWDSVTADPGTTAPRVVLPVPFLVAGVFGTKRRYKYVFPGGLPFGTGLSYLATTTHDGETAAPATDIAAVEVHFEIM